jgi:hypothetical protein
VPRQRSRWETRNSASQSMTWVSLRTRSIDQQVVDHWSMSFKKNEEDWKNEFLKKVNETSSKVTSLCGDTTRTRRSCSKKYIYKRTRSHALAFLRPSKLSIAYPSSKTLTFWFYIFLFWNADISFFLLK